MSYQALFERLDQSLEILSLKLAELIKLASIQEVDTDIQNYNTTKNSNNTSFSSNPNVTISSDLAVATDGVSMVNNHTHQLIKSVQDLLILTRTIREAWLLNQIPNNSRATVDKTNGNGSTSNEQIIKQQEIDYEYVGNLIDIAINTIIN